MQGVEYIKVTAKDGEEITGFTYNIDDTSKKGVVVICHGFGEHAASYEEHAERLWRDGYASIVFDQRGHGKPPEGSKNWHGCIPDYHYFIDDVVSVTDFIKEKVPGTPIALYGHSMGGNIAINTLLRISPEQAAQYFCAIFESPWLELYKPLSPVMVCAVKVLNRIAPKFRQQTKLKHDEISSDTEKNKDYSKDPYYHGFMSMRMLKGIMDGCSYAFENAAKLQVKSLLACADNDLIVSKEAMLKFADKAGDIVTVKEYASNHAIYNDVQREPYCKDVIAFMDSCLPS